MCSVCENGMTEAPSGLLPRARRLIVGAYDQVGHQLLGAACSAPIRVLANNDVPSGAAFIQLRLPIRAAWEGWQPHALKVRAGAAGGARPPV